jgi:hypothetical protein
MLAFKRHETDPLLTSSKQQAAKKGQTGQLELKSSAVFPAIKPKKQTGFGEVTKLQ